MQQHQNQTKWKFDHLALQCWVMHFIFYKRYSNSIKKFKHNLFATTQTLNKINIWPSSHLAELLQMLLLWRCHRRQHLYLLITLLLLSCDIIIWWWLRCCDIKSRLLLSSLVTRVLRRVDCHVPQLLSVILRCEKVPWRYILVYSSLILQWTVNSNGDPVIFSSGTPL